MSKDCEALIERVLGKILVGSHIEKVPQTLCCSYPPALVSCVGSLPTVCDCVFESDPSSCALVAVPANVSKFTLSFVPFPRLLLTK